MGCRCVHARRAALPLFRRALTPPPPLLLQVSEGYGLTETAPVISSQSLDWEDHVYGTVGQTIDGVDVKLMTADADGNYTKEVKAGEGEGELWTKGANVMQGYWRNQEATDEVIVVEADGSRWFRTGDLFSIITDEKMAGSSPPRKAAGSGYLKFTGRIKEQYKLENGKYVVPGPIEEAICLSRYVKQSAPTTARRVLVLRPCAAAAVATTTFTFSALPPAPLLLRLPTLPLPPSPRLSL